MLEVGGRAIERQSRVWAACAELLCASRPNCAPAELWEGRWEPAPRGIHPLETAAAGKPVVPHLGEHRGYEEWLMRGFRGLRTGHGGPQRDWKATGAGGGGVTFSTSRKQPWWEHAWRASGPARRSRWLRRVCKKEDGRRAGPRAEGERRGGGEEKRRWGEADGVAHRSGSYHGTQGENHGGRVRSHMLPRHMLTNQMSDPREREAGAKCSGFWADSLEGPWCS